jgi:DNA-binding PadR family transcriptional regulator
VLVALASGEQHGYALLKEVERLTEGRIRPSTGTLYGIIDRLLADGLIADRTLQGRRVYKLTVLGRRTALAETQRLESLLAQARATRALRRPARA